MENLWRYRALGRFWRDGKVSLFLWFLWLFLAFSLWLYSPFLALVWLLIFPAIEDARTGFVSDAWALGIMIVGCFDALMMGRMWDAFLSFAGVTLFFVLLFVLARGAIGSGDVILSSAVAWWFSPLSAAFFVWFSFLSAAVFSVVLLCRRKQSLQSAIFFIPFISLGGVCAYGFSLSPWWWETCRLYFG